jgi:hypothetical protein
VRTERRTFRPFDVPVTIERFLLDARLRIGDSTEFVERDTRRTVDVAELRRGEFTIELAADEASFSESLKAALDDATVYGDDAVEFAAIVTSPYLKLTDVVVRKPLRELERTSPLRGAGGRAFGAIHHGCDVEAFLLLKKTLDRAALLPWRKATWLSRAAFRLRTGLEGLGFTILPLTDDKRAELSLPSKTLRYTALADSPLETTSVSTVTLYVDEELLAHLNRTPRKNWARAFTDQLAVDVLTAVAVRAAADPQIHDATWESVQETLLGALVVMIGGEPGGDPEAHYDRLLDELRTNPLRSLARIEAAIEMRDSGRLIFTSGS